MVIACLMSVLWFVAGYSIAFGDGGETNAIWGGLGKMFLNGRRADEPDRHDPRDRLLHVPDDVRDHHAGADRRRLSGADDLRLRAGLLRALDAAGLRAGRALGLGPGGWLPTQGVRDFAGGLVVHATAGSSALVFAVLVGKRKHFPHEMRPPHSPVLVMIGAAMLWVGWYGFNAGSALSAGPERRQCDAGDAPLGLDRRAGLDGDRVDQVRPARPRRHGHRTGRRSRHHHAGRRISRPGRRADHRRCRLDRLLLRRDPHPRRRSRSTTASTCSRSTASAACSAR